MLLVITSQADFTVQNVVDLMAQPVLRINFDALEQDQLIVRFGSNESYAILDGVNLEAVTSVWYRVGLHGKVEFKKNEPYGLMNRMCREGLVIQLYEMLPNAKWVSDPYAIERAENKSFQLKVAQQLGFSIPKTLITGSSDEASRFRESLSGNLIIKPLVRAPIRAEGKDIAIFTARVEPHHKVEFSSLPSSPAIFQEEIIGEFSLRVIVANQTVFAVAIKSDLEKEVDWRKDADKLEVEATELPSSISAMCKKFVERMGLEFSSMDLIHGKDGNYYFIENNPNGSWTYFAEKAKLPIAEAIAASLG